MDSPFVPDLQRERISVRRRRARQGDHRRSAKWVATRSRRRVVQTFALCAGVLLLMAVGLYFGLAHQENAAPAEGAARGGTLGVVGVV
jgi:hypothetical protein